LEEDPADEDIIQQPFVNPFSDEQDRFIATRNTQEKNPASVDQLVLTSISDRKTIPSIEKPVEDKTEQTTVPTALDIIERAFERAATGHPLTDLPEEKRPMVWIEWLEWYLTPPLKSNSNPQNIKATDNQSTQTTPSAWNSSPSASPVPIPYLSPRGESRVNGEQAFSTGSSVIKKKRSTALPSRSTKRENVAATVPTENEKVPASAPRKRRRDTKPYKNQPLTNAASKDSTLTES
jgi:hypothetical protein